MKAINFGRALYYPHIFPQNRRWLRTAALYHDGLGRIVPRGFLATDYDRHGSLEILRDFEALQNSGFIEDEYPDDVLQDVGTQFLDFIIPSLESKERKSRLLSEMHASGWRPYSMFREKIDRSLLDILEEEGLVRPLNDYEVEFAGQVGGLYMLFLAKQMAKQRPIVSDNPRFEALTHAPPERSETPGGGADLGLVLATAVFSTTVPVDIEALPIGDLIAFRRDFEGERVSFYDGIAKLASELSAIDDQRLLHQAIEHHSHAIKSSVGALDRKLALLNLATGKGVFSVSLPAGFTGAAWGLGLTNPFALSAVGGVVVTGMLISRKFEQRLVKGESTVAYIHSLREHFGPKQYAEEFVQLNLAGREIDRKTPLMSQLRKLLD